MSRENDLIKENLMQTLITTSSDDSDEEDDNAVMLGFVKLEKLNRVPSPFKTIAGGFPPWLDPINLPSGDSTTCGICGDPLQFLFQVYAPFCEKESAFHRTLSIFMCLSMKCLLQDQHEQRKLPSNKKSRSVKVFRCQLPRSNQFYPYEVSGHYRKVKAALCSWCRTWKGSVRCNCERACYCSKKHQAAHRHKGHNLECQKLAVDREHINSSFVPSNTIWPQFRIGMTVESRDDTMSEIGGDATELASACHADEGFDPILYSFEADADKKSSATFQERVLGVPEQVLRYCRHAGVRPLWPWSSGRPSETDVPNCSHCGGPRCFEFQIMPQLLHYFKVDDDVNSLDWSTIVIYTCEASCDESMPYYKEEASCDESMPYKEEFAWVQVERT